MSAIDERREELMRFHASDLRALARLKHVNLGGARTMTAIVAIALLSACSTGDAENAKLRELVAEIYEDQCNNSERWRYRDRMRELGIELNDCE